jgi:hypothetical protein
MKKGDLHYIVFTNDGQVLKLASLSGLLRIDIKLILKRTFIKKSNGMGLYKYFSTVPIDVNFNETSNKVFTWNTLTCKILKDERWGWPEKNHGSVLLDIEIRDHLDIKKTYTFDMYPFGTSSNEMIEKYFLYPFKKLQSTLLIIDRVGSHQALEEIEALKSKNLHLEKIIKRLKEDIIKINNNNRGN